MRDEGKKIPIGNGQFTLVDEEDYNWLNQYMWFMSPQGYVQINYSHSKLCHAPILNVGMGRLILGLEPGDKRQADHRNHNILDNRRCNLRICTCSQNQWNCNVRLDGTSKYKGVCWHKKARKWQSNITIHSKQKHLGHFENERTAAFAYNLAAKKEFGKFALLNRL